MCEFIDTRAGTLTLEDKMLLMMGPVPWRDAEAVTTIAEFYRQYCTQMRVRLVECLKKGPHLSNLEDVEACMKTQPQKSSHQMLNALEGLHKVLVFYLWMHMRSPVGWHDHVEVSDLKTRTERALDWCLQGISWHSKQSHLPDIVALRRKKEYERIAFIDQEFIRKRTETRRNQKRVGGKTRSGH
jgi:ATP-dependent RNA helicase SUPV3L1/SUV3